MPLGSTPPSILKRPNATLGAESESELPTKRVKFSGKHVRFDEQVKVRYFIQEAAAGVNWYTKKDFETAKEERHHEQLLANLTTGMAMVYREADHFQQRVDALLASAERLKEDIRVALKECAEQRATFERLKRLGTQLET